MPYGNKHEYKRRKNGRHSYPWGEMEYGDYIIVAKRDAASASAAAYSYGKSRGLCFVRRAFGTRGRIKIYHLPFGGY
jgi:hypothetical protein